MHIIYFTTAIDKDDYDAYLKEWNIGINSKGQVFHDKLIRCLATKNKVTVVSFRPFSRQHVSEKRLKGDYKIIRNVHYCYLPVMRNTLKRSLCYRYESYKVVRKIKKDKESIIVTDTINPSVVRNAKRAAKKSHLKIVGIARTTPSGINNTTKSFTVNLLEECSDFDGYICCTEDLNSLFNKNGKPSYILPGLVEDKDPVITKIDEKYIYYNGTLDPKHGVDNLIDAYKSLDKKKAKLYISGYGENKEFLDKISDVEGIKYLGCLTQRETENYIYNALININVRPFTEDYERYSVPFKVLDYINAGNLTISTKNNKLQKYFKNEVIWLKSNEVKEIAAQLDKALSLTKADIKTFASVGKEKAHNLFALKPNSEGLVGFLKDVLNNKTSN
ncbi:MAG: glycosyltransferase [Coprobacillus sp.]|nr:glycosyltransferase [Coprobacillus sp.]